MKMMRWYILVMVVLVSLYLIAEYNRPKTINWQQTFSSRDKIPYGTYIVFNQLNAFFTGNGARPVEMRKPLYDQINNSAATNEIYVIINVSFNATEADCTEMRNYIAAGNTMFISAEQLSDEFEKEFKITIDRYGEFIAGNQDSATINFVNQSLKERRNYTLQKNTLEAHLTRVDTAASTALGINNRDEVNFIRMKIGKGYLYLNTVPRAFTNFFALKDNNITYINKAFSYLPVRPSKVYWDEYFKLGRVGSNSPLRVILSNPNLKWAYYLALAGIFIFVLFQMKRRQRLIPIVVPPKNDSKEFVETVSRVYLNQKHHLNIAEKKIGYWLDYVRTKVGISTKELDEAFVDNVHNRTGVSKADIQNIIGYVRMCRVRPAIEASELLKINQLIDNFYKQAKR